MRAAVLHGPFDLRIEEINKPICGQDEAIIKVKAIGICGGDVHFYEGTHPYKNYPRIHGHELSGVIDEIFENDRGLKKGDPVVLEPLIACGKCYPCRIGKYNCCVDLKVIGAHIDGGFAEYIAVPVNRIHRIPDSLPFDIASLCEPYSIGAQCVKRATVVKEDTVAIIGAGAIGLTVLDFVKKIGAKALVADVHPYRIEMAKSFGADITVNSKDQDIYESIMKFTDNEGCSVVMEATGVAKVMENTENLVAAGGRILIVGLTNEKVAFSGINFTRREMTILGSRNSAGVFPFVIDAVSSGEMYAEKMITRKFDFDEIVDAFDFTYKNLSNVGKVVIEFSK